MPLVQGDDLTVRDGRVYLKTLAGLEPVDLIMRCFEDAFCDPLELRGDSLLGVPGLVQAARGGGVVIDNALGSGVVEGPGFLAFLPGLCRLLLGEELSMPSVATWWCGQAEACQYVLEHLDNLVVRPASTSFGQPPEFPASLDGEGREKLIAAIKAHPERYVAQEEIALSTAPSRTEGGLAPRRVVLRVFASWDGQSYGVMPGGLARVSHGIILPAASSAPGGCMQRHLGTGGHRRIFAGAQPASLLLDASARRSALPSRVADNLFWLGRYTERVEAHVRLFRALLPALSAEEDFGHALTLDTAVSLLAGLGFLPPQDATASLAEQRWRVQRFLTEIVYDPSRISSLGWNLKQMHRVARQLKERLSGDTWHALRRLDAEFSGALPVNQEHRYIAQFGVLDRAVMTLSALSGLLMENTTRGEGWRFVQFGRRLERAWQLAELLRVAVVEAPPSSQPYLHILLQVADSSITYRTRHVSILRTDLVLQLLLVDELNPRSIGFQIADLADQLHSLGRE